MRRPKQFTFILSLLIALAGFSIQAHAGNPTDQMKVTVDEVMATLRTDAGWAQKEPLLREVISKRFFYRAMAQRTLATNWKKATDTQKQEFIDLYSELLLFTYLDRIKAYTNEKVEFMREKLKKRKATVYTQIVTETANIPINYKLLLTGDKWLVYDVIIEEVSLVSNYRSTYKEIVKKDGIDGLLKQMRDKNQELTASG